MNKFKLPNMITYLGVLFSCVAMIYSTYEKMNISMACLILAEICDLFDGRFARSFKRTKEEKLTGIELDSLSDVVNFLMCQLFYA